MLRSLLLGFPPVTFKTIDFLDASSTREALAYPLDITIPLEEAVFLINSTNSKITSILTSSDALKESFFMIIFDSLVI